MLGPPLKACPAEFVQVFSHWQPYEFENEISDAVHTCQFAQMNQVWTIVLDDYRVNEDYQSVLIQHKMQWVQFDGAVQKNLWADLVINAMPGTHADSYTSRLKNPHTRLLLGPDYALLRPGFNPPTLIDTNGQRGKRLFVFAGGGDDKQVLKLVLEAVLSIDAGLTVCVVTTTNNPGLNDLKHWIKGHAQSQKIELHVNANDMPSLMRSCSMAVISAGTVTYEVNATGLRMVLFSMAHNQNVQALAWKTATGACFLGDYRQLTCESIAKAVSDMLENDHTPVKKWVDGQGAQRVVQAMMECMA